MAATNGIGRTLKSFLPTLMEGIVWRLISTMGHVVTDLADLSTRQLDGSKRNAVIFGAQ